MNEVIWRDHGRRVLVWIVSVASTFPIEDTTTIYENLASYRLDHAICRQYHKDVAKEELDKIMLIEQHVSTC